MSLTSRARLATALLMHLPNHLHTHDTPRAGQGQAFGKSAPWTRYTVLWPIISISPEQAYLNGEVVGTEQGSEEVLGFPFSFRRLVWWEI